MRLLQRPLALLFLIGMFSAYPQKAHALRTLQAECITAPATLAVYQLGEMVKVLIKGSEGTPLPQDRLNWSLCDYRNKITVSGSVPFGINEWNKGITLTLDGGHYPAGFYYLRLTLQSDSATVPWEGTRPAGFISLGWLPEITPLPLKYADHSRFGATGTNPLFGRDPFAPLYTTLGLRWAPHGGRLSQYTTEKPFPPRSDAELLAFKKSSESRNGLAFVYDAHGVPAHLQKLPRFINPLDVARRPTERGQLYGLRNPAAYEALFTEMADQARRRRELTLPQMSCNYYQLHWEPDWHYRGNDEDLIAQYAAARRALDKADPTGILLAGNYGCIDVGNTSLERLFKKGLGKHINGLATHLYNSAQSGSGLPNAGGGSPESAEIDQHCRKLRRLADTYIRPGALIIQTEWGQWYNGPIRLAEKPETLTQQLAWFLRGHLIAIGEGIDCTWFFHTADYKGVSPKQRDSGRAGYGFFFNQDPAGRACGARKVSPKPTAMGIAAAVRLLDGTQSLGRLDHFGKDVVAYSFRRADQYLMMLWSPNTEKHITLDTDAPTVTVYDVMGNARKLTAKDGRITLTLDRQPTYVLGLGQAAIANSMSRKVVQALPGETLPQSLLKKAAHTVLSLEQGKNAWSLNGSGRLPSCLASGGYRLVQRSLKGRLRTSRLVELIPSTIVERLERKSEAFILTCCNRSKHPQAFNLIVFSNEKECHQQHLTIEGQAKKSLRLPYTFFSKDPNMKIAKLCFALRNERGIESYKGITWAGVPLKRLTHFTRWYGKKKVCYNRKSWRGDDDFSARYCVNVLGDTVAVELEVRDDVAHPTRHKQYTWRGDCAMIVLGSEPEVGSTWMKQRRFYLRRLSEGKVEAGELVGSPAQEVRPTPDLQGTVTRDETLAITRYRFVVPFRAIDDPQTIRKNGCFNLGISVIDVDTEDDVQKDRHRDMPLLSGVNFFFKGNKGTAIYLND